MPSEHSHGEPEANFEPSAPPPSKYDPAIEGYVKKSDDQDDTLRRDR